MLADYVTIVKVRSFHWEAVCLFVCYLSFEKYRTSIDVIVYRLTVVVIVCLFWSTWARIFGPKIEQIIETLRRKWNPTHSDQFRALCNVRSVCIPAQKSIYATHFGLIAFETKIELRCDFIRMRSIDFIDIHLANKHMRLRHLHILFASFFFPSTLLV